ncbi:hypothetical protein [Mesorhizobium sp. M6A.T.Cr.TU.016.01.1.1]|uniref:hypothetical protein n=1 Tax=unclassified Mesorhizobium TaxID=325217 RepID=UPI0032AEC096
MSGKTWRTFPLPCRVDLRAVCRARRQILAGQQSAGAGQHSIDLGQLFAQRVLLVRVFSKVFAGIVVRTDGGRRGIESGANSAGARPVAALPFAATQRQKAGPRQRPVSFLCENAAAGAQHGVRPGELVGRSADVHVGVVQQEVFGMDELAVEPQRGGGVGKVSRSSQPSRTGLLATRSSRRARRSSAVAFTSRFQQGKSGVV